MALLESHRTDAANPPLSTALCDRVLLSLVFTPLPTVFYLLPLPATVELYGGGDLEGDPESGI